MARMLQRIRVGQSITAGILADSDLPDGAPEAAPRLPQDSRRVAQPGPSRAVDGTAPLGDRQVLGGLISKYRRAAYRA